MVEVAWLVLQSMLFASDLPGSGWRRLLLRAFGASVGEGVIFKPRVRIKFPWRLSIGAHSWIGEAVWIDNLAQVDIGAHACISQGAYLCTGNHDWASTSFDLLTQPIFIGDHTWVGAMSQLAPGSRLAHGSVLAMGSRLSGDTEIDSIYSGSPARRISART